MNSSRDENDSTEDGAESPTTGDKIVLGASIAGATLGACLGGPVGAIVGLRVGGALAVAGVEKFDDSDVENKVKTALHELRQNATTLRKTAHLTPASFYAIVDHLNLMTARYTAPLHRRIVFNVVKFSDPAGGRSGEKEEAGAEVVHDKNWKKFVFVKCRVMKTGDVWEIESTRRLTLNQFVILHEQFIAQISMDTCYDKSINARRSPGAANDDDDGDDDDDDNGDADEPIAVSTGIVDEMGFEHLEVVESPKLWQKQKRKNRENRESSSNESGHLSSSTRNFALLSPSSASPTSPGSPPNTPAIVGPRTFTSEVALTGLESALSGVSADREGGVVDDGVDSPDSDARGAVGGAAEEPIPAIYPDLGTTDANDGGDDDGDDCCGKDDKNADKNRDICCICMESEAVVILPCYHSFCETCIDSWVASRRSTCPLCRSKMGKKNDRWEVIEQLPPDFDVKTEIGKVILHMAKLCGKPYER